MRLRKLMIVGCAAGLLATTACNRKPLGPPVDRPQVPAPVVSGPVTGGKNIPFTAALPSLLEPAGYREDEYFVSGKAVSYQPKGKLGDDGRWALQAAAPADYKTRVLVRRPKDPAKFSGNVVVEWFNVSGGADADPDFAYMYPELLPAGDAYVGVSAQKISVDGSGSVITGTNIPALTGWDPPRYGSLKHPGDPYSYDIFSQVGQALKAPGAGNLLGGQLPKHVIAAGESQSGGRLFSYVDGVAPLAKVYDGYFVHSRAAMATGFGPDSASSMPTKTRVRTDLDTPVLQFITETDLAAFFNGRQPDTDKVRTWEVAGTSHADKWMLDAESTAAARVIGKDANVFDCPGMNEGPGKYVARQAYAALKTWVAGGPTMAKGQPLQATSGTAIAHDAHGNALGGVRSPDVDAPIATHTTGNKQATGAMALVCGIFGSTVPFDAATLRSLYPTHDDYVAKVTAAADRAVTAGFLRTADATAIVQAARDAKVPPPTG